MENRPNESEIIAYLYGEISVEEKEKVEKYLLSNPEFRVEMDELANMRELLGKWEDEEVEGPDLYIVKDKVRINSFVRNWLAIASSILILIIAGYFTGFRVERTGDQWFLGFGEGGQGSNGREELEILMASTLAQVDKKLDSKIEGFRRDMSASLIKNAEENQRIIDESYARLVEQSKEQVASYVNQLDRKQKRDIENLFAMSQEQQRYYFSEILTDFNDYLVKQRKEELEYVQAYLNNLKTETDQKLLQTDQILASIITQVNKQTISD